MTVAIALPSLGLSQDEEDTLGQLTEQLQLFQPENEEKAEYYDGKRHMDDLRIAIPPTLAGLEVAVGWPAAAVDCLDERLDFEAWLPNTDSQGSQADSDPYGLEELYLENDLDTKGPLAHLDALMYGVAFAAVTTGDTGSGEPDPLITIESPENATALIDARANRATAGYMQRLDLRDQTVYATLLLPDETIWLENPALAQGAMAGGSWTILERDRHNLGRVPMALFLNRPRSGIAKGHSEMTETVRRVTQGGLRTMANAEVAREYFAAPQRYVLGAKQSFFEDQDGNPIPAWKSYMGRLLALERDEYGDLPDVKEFAGQSLESFFSMMRTLAQVLSGEAGIPQNYLGFWTDNPASADAINAMETRLVKRAERRQKWFGRGWTEVARLAWMVREGSAVLPAEALRIRPKWRPAHTPTQAAAADAATKLISAGALPPTGQVTWDRLDISRAEQKMLTADLRRATVQDMITNMRGAAQSIGQQQALTAPEQQNQAGTPVPGAVAAPGAPGGPSGGNQPS